MNRVWIIARREFKAYFASPTAYVVAAAIMLVVGIIFALNINFAVQQPGIVPGMDTVSNTMAFMLVFTIPAVTMRLLSSETRSGTIELLMTAPVKDWEVVVGKWLGAMLFMLCVMAVTMFYPLILNGMVDPGIDMGIVFSSYIGLILVTSAFLAIGVMMSSMFENQVATFISTMGLFVVIWFLLSAFAQFSSSTSALVIRYLDFRGHFGAMVRGVIELKDVLYYVSVTSLFLMIGTVSLEIRRWR